MAATDAGRRPAWEDWLIQRALYPAQGSRVGFYDGLHGVAHVLDYLGYQREAIKVLEICVDEVNGRYDRLGTDLHSGLAGVGLNLLHFAGVADEPALWAEALNVADAVAGQLGAEDDVAETSGGDLPYAGLLRGSSGPALLFIRLFERTGDSTFLDLAHTALSQDLRRCYLRPEGSLEVNEGWRTMPYLADGSVGIGCVLDDYLAHRDDERLADAAAAIRRAAEGILYIEPGLFHVEVAVSWPGRGADGERRVRLATLVAREEGR